MDYSKYLPLQRACKNHRPLSKTNINHQSLAAGGAERGIYN